MCTGLRGKVLHFFRDRLESNPLSAYAGQVLKSGALWVDSYRGRAFVPAP